jgi:predicted RND superfamily exporter protein
MKYVIVLILLCVCVLLIYWFIKSFQKSKVIDKYSLDSKINTYSKLINAQSKFAAKISIVMLFIIVLGILYNFIKDNFNPLGVII